MEEILSQARKIAEQAEVFQVSSRIMPVNFEANRLKEIQAKESTTNALRLIKGGKVGFAQANGAIEPKKLVEMAEETCQFGTAAKFNFPSPKVYPRIDVFDSQVEKVNIESMVQLGEQLIAAVTQHTPSIVCEAMVTKGIITVNIVNSEGGNASYSKSFFNVSLEGVLIKNEDMLFVGDSLSSCHPIVDFKPIAKEVTMQLDLAKRNASLSTKLMPAIFTPRGVASALTSPLISAFNGKIVFDGASPLKDKLGLQVFDKNFSLWDDATLPYQVASYPCDDEGVPSQRTSLIDSGVVSHFIYDLQTAALAKTQSTGNGERHGGVPAPSPSSLIINKGDTSFGDMIKDAKEGLLIDTLIGAEQGNILNGDFSGNVLLGYKIENGEITGRVKDIMVAGNVYKLLAQIEAIGKDARWVEGFLLTPCLYCSGLSVASKTG
ncbi:MAG: peptidase C69 [Chloroflexi bacterium RBG_13_48_17]|nr:MAG: peptidase C69 [Chloroflexi bacterium RBG_13_48_17]